MTSRNPTKKRTLTPKQLRYAQEYVATGNASLAVRVAYGYAGSGHGRWAQQLKQHPLIAAYIQQLESERLASALVTRNWALQKLYQEAEAADGTRGKLARIKSVELAMKYLGLLVEQRPASVAVHSVAFALSIGERDLRPVPPALDSGPPALVLVASDQDDSDQGDQVDGRPGTGTT